jgi:hypothetical protein
VTSDQDSLDDEALSKARRRYDTDRRIIDQSISMQAGLRDRDARVAKFLTCTVLIASVVGVAFAFASSDESVQLIGVTAKRTTWLGCLAVLTFAVTLVDLVVDAGGSARRRADAVSLLFNLKADYGRPLPSGQELATLERLRERYVSTMDLLPEIPERHFNRLKAQHIRKVEISKILSETPGISYREASRRLTARVEATRPKLRP